MRPGAPAIPTRPRRSILPASPTLALGLFAATLLIGSVVVATAAEFRRGERAGVAAGEIVDDDLYVSGSRVLVEGTVNGDVVAFGGNVTVRGAVNGSVIAAGGRVLITGPVTGTVRAAGGRVTLGGTVGRDAVMAGGVVRAEPLASVRRDLVAAGGRVAVGDTIGDDALIMGDHLHLMNTAVVSGNLDYGSKEPLLVDPSATVAGDMRNHSGRWKMRSTNPQKRAVLATWHWTRGIGGMFLLGLLLVLPFPGFTRRTLDHLGRSVFGSLLTGFATLFVLPLVAAFLLLLGILVGGWWLGLFAFALWILAMLLGYAISAIVVGRWAVARLGGSGVALAWTLLVGLVVLGLIRLLPVLGLIVACAAMLLGLGALTIAIVRRPKAPAHAMAPAPEALAGP